VMGAEGAAKIVFRGDIKNADDPVAEEKRLVAGYKEKFANPYQAAARGYVDDVIDPRRTRPALIQALELLRSKRDTNPAKKHGNIPL
jgi:acetyl-CoA carboxylase carboxyltransferase component